MRFSGKVVRGTDVGAKFGIATANIQPKGTDILSMRYGVYFVDITWRGDHLNGLLHFGPRKTFGGEVSIEVHILDFQQPLYDEVLDIHLLRYLRPTRSFQNADALFTQISVDVLRARKFFLRRSIFRQWGRVTSEQKESWADEVLSKIQESSFFQESQRVLAYAPSPVEIPFVKKLTQVFPEKEYYYPKVDGARVSFYLSDFDDLTPGQFNIPEPEEAGPTFAPEKADLALVPAVAVDAQHYRLGRGGGFYDRILEHYQGPTISALPAFCKVEAVPTEPHDQRVGQVIVVGN